MSKAKQYARLRDQQFSLYEQYARQHGMNYKGLLILLWLYNNPAGISQKTLCDRTYSTKQVVYAIIQNYIQKGYAKLKNSASDKRSKLVVLTEEGRAYAAEIVAPLDAMEEKAMAQLTIEQIEALFAATACFTQYLGELMEERK
ncbi:MarR family winged helix-turn-helix transcriptional regulator [Streptococcus merionis]|uniref:MarR family winged helix-turn-helix transcriptional regulator n=1 Tax=Streptococcus merionis TaxID=400065 RepID=UPI0026EAA6BB|nr:MarR family winged helix-turn-helix transcriptional regulator [Streptococcus merionis]